ncbi:helix-hairpin-helix domain-containing protein [Halanaerobacter jeridensis]|uniref:DNA polymerase III alpha subunit n=1 Tax=Halanaerobacter jeridensis TaxID=706427 RepID=A0A939BNJ1_9FIRM|nr:OB-fold nucleic acid binding domain-containing protein [Halanaerobacter jeridensis]MBM7555577.1 DNA polymerase III alpha subunit [Halanaerobacter jeridensis]
MEKQKKSFIEGTIENGYTRELAEELFELIEYFGGYGFNKAHSAAYAYVSYYTAYLKTYYPVEFMAALLSSQMGNSDKVADYINEARRMGIEVLGPDVNYSRVQFTVEDGKIRFGLEAVKNVGAKAIEEIINARTEESFTDLRDFCDRVDVAKVNQRVVESLIKAGAFASFSAHRSQLLEIVPQVFSQAQSSQRKRGKGQTSFADLVEDDEQFGAQEIKLPDIDEFKEQKLLSLEKEMLGLYFSGHPLDNSLDKIKSNRTAAIEDLAENINQVVVGGIIISCREITTKNHREMAFLSLEDESGEVEIIVFPDTYAEAKELIAEDNVILIKGRTDEEGKLIASQVTDIQDTTSSKTKVDNKSESKSKSKQDKKEKQSQSEKVHLQVEDVTLEKLQNLESILAEYPGPNLVYLHLVIKGHRISIRLSEKYSLHSNNKELREKLDELGVKYAF